MAAPKAEGTVAVPAVDNGHQKPVMIVLERADDGTWVAVPEYADEDDERAPPTPTRDDVVPDGGGLPRNVTAGSREHNIMLLRWSMACTITDFKHDLVEFIDDYFNPSVDRDMQMRRLRALLRGQLGDEHAREMLLLLYAGLDRDVPADDADKAAGGEDADPGLGGHQLHVDGDASHRAGSEPEGLTAKPVSAAGFVHRLYMRRCIKAFFYPDIDVHDEDKDTFSARHLWGNFMSATGFVNRLWDVRRITEVFFDHDLDQETRKATMAAMLGDLEALLKARATAVATGTFNLF